MTHRHVLLRGRRPRPRTLGYYIQPRVTFLHDPMTWAGRLAACIGTAAQLEIAKLLAAQQSS